MLLFHASSRPLRCYRAGGGRGAPGGGGGGGGGGGRGGGGAVAQTARDGGGRGHGGRGLMARIGQGIDPLELLVDGAAQGERIEAGAVTPQLRGHRGGNLRAGEHAVERRLRGVIATADARTDPFFAEELDGG